MVEKISIKINNYERKYIRVLPLHHSQKEIETTAEYSVFQYILRPTYDFMQELLSHGYNIEIIEPESLRKSIGDIVEILHDIYRK